jgi:NAD(P)-dependent dehydrogenase (short-subunit alcohol dehydrogenase family)
VETTADKLLCQELRDRGWQVNTAADAETNAPLDLLICNAAFPPGVSASNSLDFKAIQQTYDTHALGTLRFVQRFLPQMQNGGKRLCFLTDASGSLGAPIKAIDIGEAMSRTALHMAVKILFNDLRRDHYTFRLFLPDPDDPEGSVTAACDYFLTGRDDDDHLVIRNFHGAEVPF